MLNKRLTIIAIGLLVILVALVLVVNRQTAVNKGTVYETNIIARNMGFPDFHNGNSIRFYTGTALADYQFDKNFSVSLTQELPINGAKYVRWGSHNALVFTNAWQVVPLSSNTKPSVLPGVSDAIWDPTNDDVLITATLSGNSLTIGSQTASGQTTSQYTVNTPGSNPKLVTKTSAGVVLAASNQLWLLNKGSASPLAKLSGNLVSSQLIDQNHLLYITQTGQSFAATNLNLQSRRTTAILSTNNAEFVGVSGQNVILINKSDLEIFDATTGKQTDKSLLVASSDHTGAPAAATVISNHQLQLLIVTSTNDLVLATADQKQADSYVGAALIPFTRVITPLASGDLLQYNFRNNTATITANEISSTTQDSDMASIRSLHVDPNQMIKLWVTRPLSE